MENNTSQPVSGMTTFEAFNNEKKGSCFFFHKWTRWATFRKESMRYFPHLDKTLNVVRGISRKNMFKVWKNTKKKIEI
jgi:hypothetical protein